MPSVCKQSWNSRWVNQCQSTAWSFALLAKMHAILSQNFQLGSHSSDGHWVPVLTKTPLSLYIRQFDRLLFRHLKVCSKLGFAWDELRCIICAKGISSIASLACCTEIVATLDEVCCARVNSSSSLDVLGSSTHSLNSSYSLADSVSGSEICAYHFGSTTFQSYRRQMASWIKMCFSSND